VKKSESWIHALAIWPPTVPQTVWEATTKRKKKTRKPKEGSVIILMPQTCQKKNSIEKKLCRQKSDFKIEGQELCGEAEPCIPDLAMGACDLSSR